MASFHLSALVLFCCVAGYFSHEVPENPKTLEDIGFGIDEDDLEQRGGFMSTKWNPNKCTCVSDISCGCCVKPRIFWKKFKGCFNVTALPDENDVIKKVEVKLDWEDETRVQHEYSVGKVERVCDRLPGKASKIKVCLYTETSYTPEEGIVSCPSVDLHWGDSKTALGTLTFNCVQYFDKKMQFSGHKEINRDTMFNWNIGK